MLFRKKNKTFCFDLFKPNKNCIIVSNACSNVKRIKYKKERSQNKFKTNFHAVALEGKTRENKTIIKKRRCRRSNSDPPRDRREYLPLYYNDLMFLYLQLKYIFVHS